MPAPRRFDHDLARKLRAQGLSYGKIAAQVGVTEAAVWQALSEKGQRWRKKITESYKGAGACTKCGAPTNLHAQRYTGAKLCITCRSLAHATSVRPDQLMCFRCKEWKPDEEFHHSSSGAAARRKRHSFCRACNTIQRREHRQRNREASNAYDREYKRKRRWEKMTPLQRATSRISETAP